LQKIAQSALEAAQHIVTVGVKFESTVSAYKAITGSQALAAKEMSFVSEEAHRLGLNLANLEQVYKSLIAGAQGTALEGENVKKIFTAVTTASSVLGLSVEQTEGALRALEQMISKGNVQAEELRGQLSERLPGAFNMAAEAMGVTTSELNDMLKKGEVLASDLLPKLADVLLNKYGASAEEAGNTSRAAFENFRNAVEELSRTLASSGIVGMLGSIATAATTAINKINSLMNTSSGVKRVSEINQEILEINNKMAATKGGLLDGTSMHEANINAQKERIKLLESEKASLTSLQREEERIFVAEKKIKTMRAQATKEIAQQKLIESGQIQGALSSFFDFDEKTIEKESKKAASAAKKVASAVAKAAKESAREAEQIAKEHQRILERFQEDYNKATLNNADYQELKLKQEIEEYKKHVKDKTSLDKWYASEFKKIEETRTKDTDKALKEYFDEIDDLDKELTDNFRAEAEKRARILEDALEYQLQAYEDFVYDVQSATSDMFMELFDGGFSSLFSEMETLFKRTLANMAAEAITKPIIVPVIQSFSGAVGSTISNAMGIKTQL